MISKILRFIKTYPVIGSALRILRTAGAMGGGVALTYIIGHVADLPIDNVQVAAILTLALVGLDKFLREKGIIRYTSVKVAYPGQPL
jgi:hypothetical protein